MNKKGHVKIYRNLVEWKWFKRPNTLALYIYCLLNANWKDSIYEGKKIPRGSFVTGRKKISCDTGLTEQEVRTSLNHLISTNDITKETTNKYTIITIVNYELYQKDNQKSNNQLTNNQPTTNQQLTTSEEINKKSIRSVCVEEASTTTPPTPTLDELRSYCFGNGMQDFDYEKFYNHYQSCGWVDKNGKAIADWKAKVKYWYDEDKKKGRLKKVEVSRELK